MRLKHSLILSIHNKDNTNSQLTLFKSLNSDKNAIKLHTKIINKYK